MELLQKTNILEFNPDTLETVRKLYDLDKPGILEQAIDALVDWTKKQNHFKRKEFERGYLERIIISRKGSVERAKIQIDKICTLRTLMPRYFENFNLEKEHQNWRGVVFHAVVPKLTEDNDRLFIIKNYSKKSFDSNFLPNCYKYYTMLAEYVKAKDYANGYIVVLDLSEMNMTELISKLSPIELRQFLILLMEGYGVRIKGIHIITESKMVDVIVMIFKQACSEKLSKRIYVHKSVNSLQEVLPRKVLPKEYGGLSESLVHLDEMCYKEICSEEFKEYWMTMGSACTDESLRQTDKFNEQYVGMPGTFKTLSVD